MNRKLITLALASLPPTVSAAAAQSTTLKNLSVDELLDLRVTSVSKRSEPLSNAAASIYVITARRHPAQRCHHPDRSAAAGAESPGRAYRHRAVRNQRARLQQRHRQQAARADRRPQRLHAALLGRVLGRAGRAAGGRRAHRGHPRPRRHALGRQRGQRRDQRDHAARRPTPRAARGRGGGGQRARVRRRALGRHRWGARPLPRRTASTPSRDATRSAGTAAMRATTCGWARAASAPTGGPRRATRSPSRATPTRRRGSAAASDSAIPTATAATCSAAGRTRWAAVRCPAPGLLRPHRPRRLPSSTSRRRTSWTSISSTRSQPARTGSCGAEATATPSDDIGAGLVTAFVPAKPHLQWGNLFAQDEIEPRATRCARRRAEAGEQ